MNILFTSLTLVSIALLCACSDLAPLDKELSKIGYTRDKPPRTDHGAGWVFQFAKNIDGRTVTQTVCSRLFDDDDSIKIQTSATVLPDIKISDKDSASFSVDLVQAIKGVSGGLSTEINRQKDVTLQWGNTSVEDVALADWYTKSGSIAISQECKNILQKIKARKGLDTVFVAQEALKVESFSYKFKSESSLDASAKASWEGLLQGQGSVSSSGTDETTLTINQPIILGQKIFALKDIDFDQDEGPAFAKVAAEPVSSSQVIIISQ